MNAIPGFAKLKNSGASINLTTPLNVTAAKKSNDPDEQKLAKYRETYRTGEVNIPETVVSDLGNLLDRLTFKLTNKFIQHIPVNLDELVEYDVDEEDMDWIQIVNEDRKKDGVEGISVEKFEIAIDRLEKSCKFEARGGGNSGGAGGHVNSDDETDDVCCVCHDGDVSNANQIIYCDMCNIAVHQDCYGVPYIPEGSWLCRRCKLSPAVPVECCLCPNLSGAFKPTSDGRWAHVVCAIWLNEVHFGNAVFLEPIEGCKETLKIRKVLRCLYCREKRGACLQCSSRMCFKAFHVTCARQLGLMMKVETDQDPEDGEEVDVKRFVFCQKHASGNNMSNKEFQKSIRNARKNLEASGNHVPTITMPSISRVNVDKIANDTEIENFEDIVVYWYQKRRSRAGVPLIKRLTVEVVPKEKRNVASTSSQMNDEERKSWENFRMIRNSLETARLLSEQAKKREINKKAELKLIRALVENAFITVDHFLLRVLSRLEAKDSKGIFLSPVKLDGYSAIIKNPMDMTAMKAKIRKFKYSSVSDMRKDVLLITDNCAKFNHDNEYYLKYGKKFKKSALSILEEEEEVWKQTESIQANKAYLNQILDEICANNYTRVKNDEEVKEEEKEEEDYQPPTRKFRADQPSTSKEADLMEAETPVAVESSSRRGRKKASAVASTSTPSQRVETVELRSPLEQEEQLEDDEEEVVHDTKKSATASSWKALFSGATTPHSNKRKNTNPPATTPKRKRETAVEAGQTLLPFLAASKEPQLTFSSIAKNGTAVTPLSPRASRHARNGGQFSMSFRDSSSVRSPLPADTASSTEYSTDEDMIVEKVSKGKNSKANSGSNKLSDKRKSLPKYRTASQKVDENPIEKAKNEAKSIFAHNAIVNVDGKAAKVIDMQYAHLCDISKEQRHQMFTSRPSRMQNHTPSTRNSGSHHQHNRRVDNDDDEKLVYVEFFQKLSSNEQYKWVSSERVSLIDLSNTNNKSKIAGLKAAKEWQQNILNK